MDRELAELAYQLAKMMLEPKTYVIGDEHMHIAKRIMQCLRIPPYFKVENKEVNNSNRKEIKIWELE